MLELDGTLIIAMISFIIFAFIMNVVLYQPIIKILDERKAFLDTNENIVNNANEEAYKLVDTKKAKLSEARKQASEKVSENSEKFKKEQKYITDEYLRKQRELSDVEKRKMSEDAKLVKNELSNGVIEISNIISEKILGEKNV